MPAPSAARTHAAAAVLAALPFVLTTLPPNLNASKKVTTDDTLRMAMGYFESRGAHEIISFQCTTTEQAALLRLASDGGIPAQFQRHGAPLHRTDEFLFNRIGVFVNASCPGAVQVLLDASRELRFNGSYVWFLCGPVSGPAAGNVSTDLLELAEGLNLAADSTVALLPDGGDLMEVHKVYYHLPLQTTPLQTTARARLPPSARRTNLTGVTVRTIGEAIRGTELGWNQFPQYLDGFIRDEDPGDIFKQGPRLFDLMRQLYNFTFAMRMVAGGGVLMSNGSCSGIPGYLERGDFDFGLQLWLDESRMQCVQYVAYNLITFESALVYRMPTRSSSAVNSMVTPFSSGSWAGVFVMFGMMALLLLIADEFHLEEAFGNLGPWSAALIFGTAGISWGSIHYGINSTHLISVELGTVIGGLTYTVIFTYYQSSVVFGLLAKDTRPPLSPQEVIKNEYRIVSDDSAYFTDMFENTQDDDLRDIYQRYLSSKASSGYVSLGQGAHMVKDEKVALIGDRTAVAKQLNPIMTSQQLCSVRYSRTHAERSLLFSAARKGWPLADLVKRGLVLALERGLSRRIVRPFRMPCSTEDSTATQTTISALTVTAATTAYLVLTAGFVLSGSICSLETVGPRLERMVETRRISVLFNRRKSRRLSRLSRTGRTSLATMDVADVEADYGADDVDSVSSPITRIQFVH